MQQEIEDSDKSVPGMLSEHARTTLFTGDFWNVRHICATADSNGRVSVAARVAPTGIVLFPPVSLTSAGSRTTVREVFRQVRGEPDAQAPPVVCRVSGWPCSSPEEAGHGSVGFVPSTRWAASSLTLWAVRPWPLPRPPIPVF